MNAVQTLTDDPIHVALTFDDNFWAPTYATMRGICATTALRANIKFHLVHTGLSEQHAAVLASIAQEYGAGVAFYDVSQNDQLKSRIENFPKIRTRNLNDIVYARLFLVDFLPADIARLIYIDSDILIRFPIEDFYNIDLEGSVVAAANCPHRVMFQSNPDLVAKAYFRTQDPYFNAGFMLIDTGLYRELDFGVIIESRVAPEQRPNLYYDQDILNIALKGRWKVLDSSWNLQNPTIHHESLDPRVVHYTGSRKPWLAFKPAAFKRQYRHTMTNAVYYQFMRERTLRRLKRLFRIK